MKPDYIDEKGNEWYFYDNNEDRMYAVSDADLRNLEIAFDSLEEAFSKYYGVPLNSITFIESDEAVGDRYGMKSGLIYETTPRLLKRGKRLKHL